MIALRLQNAWGRVHDVRRLLTMGAPFGREASPHVSIFRRSHWKPNGEYPSAGGGAWMDTDDLGELRRPLLTRAGVSARGFVPCRIGEVPSIMGTGRAPRESRKSPVCT